MKSFIALFAEATMVMIFLSFFIVKGGVLFSASNPIASEPFIIAATLIMPPLLFISGLILKEKLETI